MLVAVRFRLGVGALVAAALAIAGGVGAGPATAAATNVHIDCSESSLCAEVANYADVFGANYYVGHDEPTATFYSNRPGSGNNMRYVFTLPRDPSASNPSAKSYSFQLDGAIWFGMALCDTQSYPEQVNRLPARQRQNIVDPAVSPNHPGTAFTELQFYPPGWVEWPVFQTAVGAGSCDPTKWCAAMNVFSLLEDPVNGTLQNDTCAAKVGIETFEFAFVTRNGHSHAPANPLDATLQTYTPDPKQGPVHELGRSDPGDHARHPTGRETELVDLNTGQRGSMTASPGQRVRADQVRPDRHQLHRDPVRLPSDVQHLVGEDARDLGRPLQQHRVHGRDRPLAVLHRRGRPGDAVRGRRERRPDHLPEHEHRGRRRDGGRRRQLLLPGVAVLARRATGLYRHERSGSTARRITPVWRDGNALHPTPIQFTSPTDRAGLPKSVRASRRSKRTCRGSRRPRRTRATGPRARTAR